MVWATRESGVVKVCFEYVSSMFQVYLFIWPNQTCCVHPAITKRAATNHDTQLSAEILPTKNSHKELIRHESGEHQEFLPVETWDREIYLFRLFLGPQIAKLNCFDLTC